MKRIILSIVICCIFGIVFGFFAGKRLYYSRKALESKQIAAANFRRYLDSLNTDRIERVLQS